MGQRITGMTSGQKSLPVAPSIFKFAQHGKAGTWVSELLPNIATISDANVSLTLEGGGLVPIGQHATTIAPDGNLLLFNNGTPSFNEPAGAPAGAKRKYSAVSSYVVDEFHRTVQQAWSFDYGQTLRSPLCSSARQVSDGSVLVDYAQADNKKHARLVGLNPSHQVVFDYEYANANACNTAWNAQPIALDSLTFQ